MQYPDRIPLPNLQSTHPEWEARFSTLRRIDDLVTGGFQLENRKEIYLKRRPGEEPEVYQLRLDRFTYTNILGGAISQQVSKLSSGEVSVTGLDSDFWDDFREGTDLARKRSEAELLQDLFRLLLKFQSAYIHVDKPAVDLRPENRAQEDALGLWPYLCLYSPLEVISWGCGGDGREQWIKIRQVMPEVDPFGGVQTVCRWTFVDDEVIARYASYVKFLNSGEMILVDAAGEPVLSDGESAPRVPLESLVPHGFGRLPIVVAKLPDDLWVTNQAYLKALEHLNLENARYDAGMLTYIQRSFRPILTPDGDLDNTFVDVDEPIKSGNAYILRGEAFNFNEASGTAIASLGSLLQEIRDTVTDMVGMARASTTRGAIAQSGVSKKMDFAVQEVILRAYGAILCDVYQDALQLVGQAIGLTPDQVGSISVTGLDTFDVDSLETAMAIAAQLPSIESYLPPTALKLFFKSLTGLMVKRASAEQQSEIDEELDLIFSPMQKRVEESEPPEDESGDDSEPEMDSGTIA